MERMEDTLKLFIDVREFASQLDPDIGPCFGEDVIKLIDILIAERNASQARCLKVERELEIMREWLKK